MEKASTTDTFNVTGKRSAGASTTYTVDQTGVFAPEASVGTGVVLGDDQVSGAIPIGFSFSFFGIAYTDLYMAYLMNSHLDRLPYRRNQTQQQYRCN